MIDWKCPKLRTIRFGCCKIEEIGSLNLPSLTYIYISESAIKDISALSDWKCPNL